MRNFQDTFEAGKRLFISDFSICMTVTLNPNKEKHPLVKPKTLPNDSIHRYRVHIK